MQADSHSKLTISREQKRKDGIILLICNNRVIFFIHSRVYSWVLKYFSASSAAPPLVSYQDSLVSWAPCFADCQWKGQLSFSQRRMLSLVPHPPHCVHKNLHNSSGKCQYTQSMMIRRFRQYSRLSHCYLDCKGWVVLFLLWHDHI